MPRSPKPKTRLPKQERAQRTIDVILEAAAQVLVREGYDHASTNRIATRAGVSIGTLYQYFADKDAIFTALLDRYITRYVEAMQRVASACDRRLEVWVLDLVTEVVRAVPNALETYRQLERVPEGVLRARATGMRRGIAAFVRAELEKRRTQLIVGDLDLAVQMVVAACEGVAINTGPTFGVGEERMLKELTSLVVRYLAGSGPPAPRESGS